MPAVPTANPMFCSLCSRDSRAARASCSSVTPVRSPKPGLLSGIDMAVMDHLAADLASVPQPEGERKPRRTPAALPGALIALKWISPLLTAHEAVLCARTPNLVCSERGSELEGLPLVRCLGTARLFSLHLQPQLYKPADGLRV